MDKPSDAFRSIGEMAKELGVKTHILRYWEEQFPMLRPLKRAGGRRHYRADDVVMLHKIHSLLQKEGYTIKGAAKFLSGSNRGVAEVAFPAPTQVQARPQVDMSALRAVRDRLSLALAAA
jgi:DNA-binding transcriptional MerR regulator